MQERNSADPPGCFVESPHINSFEVLTTDEKQIIDHHTVDITFKKGEIVAKQGSFVSHLIYLKEGLAKVYLEGNSKELILEIVPPGRFIALSPFSEGNNTFLFSAATYLDSKASLIDAKVLRQVLRTNANFASRIIRIMNDNTAQLYGRFYTLSCKQAHGRVADVVLCLSKRIYKSLRFELALGRNDLAELTGLSQESVIRILKEFRQEKLISLNGRSMEILNPDLLQKISHYG